MNDQL